MMAAADLNTLQALGFATGAALCGLMAVLQWRSSRQAGGARIHIFFWICGLIWTVPNFVRMALVLAGWPPGAPVLGIAEAIGWSSTSMGPLIGASAVGARRPAKAGRAALIGLAGFASAILLTLTLAVSFGMAFPLRVNAIAFVALGGTAVFAVASGGLPVLFNALAGRSGGRARWVVAAGVLLAVIELTTAFTARLGLHSPARQVLGIVFSQQWPIPWAILVAAFLARSHYVDVVLKRNKSGSRLLGFDSEALVKLADVGFLEETIGSLFCFDAVQAKFVRKPALKGLIDAFTAASGLGRVSRDRPDAQFCEGAADLSQMAFEDLAAGFWSQKEMAGPVGIQGAEDAVLGNTVFEQEHAV